MRKNVLCLSSPAIVFLLVIIISSSLAARDPRLQAQSYRSGGKPRIQGPTSASSGPLWARSYGLFFGGPSTFRNEEDQPWSILPLANGNFIVAGTATADMIPNTTYWAAAAACLNPSGQVLWGTAFPSVTSVDVGRAATIKSAASSPDGGCVMAGSFLEPDFYPLSWVNMVARLGADGGLRWAKFYSTGDEGALNPLDAITTTRDGGYVAVGFGINALYNGGTCVLKLDLAGNVLWSRVINSSASGIIHCVRESRDGGLILAGTRDYSLDDDDCACDYNLVDETWLIKLAANGQPQWSKSYGLSPVRCCSQVAAYAVAATSDGGFAMAGNAALPDHSSKTWVCKVNDKGTIVWQNTYAGNGGFGIIQTRDGGYLVSGGENALAIKLDGSGSVQWVKRYDRSIKTFWMADAFENAGGGYTMVARGGTIHLVPGFNYVPWVVMSVDPSGRLSPGCPFVQDISGDARVASIRTATLDISAVGIQLTPVPLSCGIRSRPIRVGSNKCR